MAIDDASDIELVEQGLDQRQRAQIDDFLRACSTMPRECHGSSCGSKLRDDLREGKHGGVFEVAPYRTHAVNQKKKSGQRAGRLGYL
jgi:hypothetical protein